MPADQYAVLTVPFDSARQDLAFCISTLCGKIVNRQTVVNAGNSLLNDRPLIQICGHVMRGGTNQFNASVVCLKIGFCAFKAWQKTVVNVDGATIQCFSHVV